MAKATDSEMAWKDFPATMEVLNTMGDRLINYYRAELDAQGVNASGQLSQNLSMVINILTGPRFQVALNIMEYWKWVEEGRKPGKFPPLGAILKWVQSKPVLPRPMANGKVPTQSELAFLIGRKIAREGSTPHPVMKNATTKVVEDFSSQLSEALSRDMAQHVTAMITTITTNN